MKNKILLIPLALLLVISLVAVGCGAPAPEVAPEEPEVAPEEPEVTPIEPIELSWSIAWPPTHFVNSVIIPWYVEEIEKRTEGRVKITLYHGGELLSAPEHYEGVVTGVADIGTSRYAYTPGRFPVACGYELPGFIYNSAYVSNSVGWELYKKYKPEGLADTHMLWIDSYGPGFLYTKIPIRTLEDFEGVEIRGDALVLEALAALGATPVSMPQPDVYLALEKGVVKGTLDHLGGLKAWRNAEVTDYIIVAPFISSSVFFFNTMNLDTWNALPGDIQKVFDEIADEIVIKSAEVFEESNTTGLEYGIEGGMELIFLSDEEEARWIEAIKQVQEEWAAEIEAMGLPGTEMLEEHSRLAEKYNKEYPYVGPLEKP